MTNGAQSGATVDSLVFKLPRTHRNETSLFADRESVVDSPGGSLGQSNVKIVRLNRKHRNYGHCSEELQTVHSSGRTV